MMFVALLLLLESGALGWRWVDVGNGVSVGWYWSWNQCLVWFIWKGNSGYTSFLFRGNPLQRTAPRCYCMALRCTFIQP